MILGIVLWEMYTFGDIPYSELNDKSEIAAFLSDGKRLEQPRNCNNETFKVLQDCWMFDCQERPKFVDLMKRLNQILENTQTDV